MKTDQSRADQAKLRSIHILYEDDFVLAVSKPPGMSVHSGAGEGRTVIDLLSEAYPERRQLYLIHRLDRGTSGVLLVGKSPEVAKTASALWSRFSKSYLGVSLGTIKGERIIDRPLPDDDGKAEKARTAVAALAVLDRIEPQATLITAGIQTGRMHQIRRHLALVGHPILMDDKHGDFPANKRWSAAVRDAGSARPKHLMLHAHRLTGPHPMTGESVEIRAETPPFWREILSAACSRVDAPDLLS